MEMKGFIAKNRGGGVSQITKGYSKSAGKNCGHSESAPQPKKILTGKVGKQEIQPSKIAKKSR